MMVDYIKAKSRGYVNMDWLKSFHSFSFANYYDPDRMHFGVLRVLNDDEVAGGKGFDAHSHKNMEIISIPLSGELIHKDSMNNEHVLTVNDVQVMSGWGWKLATLNTTTVKPILLSFYRFGFYQESKKFRLGINKFLLTQKTDSMFFRK